MSQVCLPLHFSHIFMPFFTSHMHQYIFNQVFQPLERHRLELIKSNKYTTLYIIFCIHAALWVQNFVHIWGCCYVIQLGIKILWPMWHICLQRWIYRDGNHALENHVLTQGVCNTRLLGTLQQLSLVMLGTIFSACFWGLSKISITIFRLVFVVCLKFPQQFSKLSTNYFNHIII